MIAAPPSGLDVALALAAALVWEEHCVECALPSCYFSCPLYVRRSDGKCARFEYGIAANRAVSGLFPFGADIHFRRWAKLEAYWPGRPSLYPARELQRMAWRSDILERVEAMVRRLPGPAGWSFSLGEKLRKRRKRLIRRTFANAGVDGGNADAFFVRFFYPGEGRHRLLIEIDREGDGENRNQTVFRRSLDVSHGWNELMVPAAEMPDEPGKIRVWPDNDAPLRLIFSWLDVVAFKGAVSPPQGPAPKVKCVAWDLDGTLWDGIIGEDGPDAVNPRPVALDLIRKLDARGILQTIASKNDFDRAWPKIEELGLADFFLYPAIHWEPKSGSIRRQADELDINVDTFAFIDDSAFERAEVGRTLPQVRTFDAARIDDLLARPEFDVPDTETSRTRRASYLAQARRKQVSGSWDGDNDGFLKSCNMGMRIGPVSSDRIPRCLELLQRSNQFNLSATRYSETELRALIEDTGVECFAFDVADDFGDYGVVGFAAVRLADDGPVLIDFVMSCRVARKRIEEVFVHWYADRARRRGDVRLFIRVRKTDRNGPLRDALTAITLPRIALTHADGAEILEFNLTPDVDSPTIVRVEALDDATVGSV